MTADQTRPEESQPAAPSGVLAIITDAKDGCVLVTAADFDLSGYGGFRPDQAQRIRARKRAERAVVRAFCSSVVTDCLDSYDIERIVEAMERKKAIVTSFVLIGHDDLDDETVRHDYLRREPR